MLSHCRIVLGCCLFLVLSAQSLPLTTRESTAPLHSRAYPKWVFGNHTEGSGCDHGNPIDADTINAAAYAHTMTCNASQPIVIVPGDTPIHTKKPLQLVAEERRRVEAGVRACKQHNCCVIAVSGGNVHPDNTPYNEAWEMRSYLLSINWPASKIIIDPFARHTTTNLRNVGRFMLAYNKTRGIVTTNYMQEIYLDFPDKTGFTQRCEKELGYKVGTFEPHLDLYRISFVPAPAVWTIGTDSRDP